MKARTKTLKQNVSTHINTIIKNPIPIRGLNETKIHKLNVLVEEINTKLNKHNGKSNNRQVRNVRTFYRDIQPEIKTLHKLQDSYNITDFELFSSTGYNFEDKTIIEAIITNDTYDLYSKWYNRFKHVHNPALSAGGKKTHKL